MFRHVENVPVFPNLDVKQDETGRSYRLPSGVWVPSVTTLLSHFKTKELQEWYDKVGPERAEGIKNAATRRGNILHGLCEEYLSNRSPDLKSLFPDDLEFFLKVRPILNRINNIRHIETQLYSEKLGLAGRCDVIAEFDGVPSIIDFKTTSSKRKEEWVTSYFEQATAYCHMYEEMTGLYFPSLVVIIVGLEYEPQVFMKHPRDYADSLISKIKMYRKSLTNG